jgi:hypothetical protein
MSQLPRKKRKVPSDEEIRLAILRFLYESHRKAGSLSGGRFKILDLKRELKARGLKPAEITRNLDYLVQNEWVVRDAKPITIVRSKTPVSSEQVTYRVSSRGIDLFQGESQFQAPGSLYGISIVQNAPGVIQVGSYNYVDGTFRDLYDNLDSLARTAMLSDSISDEEKWLTLAEVKTMQAQLMKREPDPTILRKAWSRIDSLRKVGALALLIEKAWNLLAPLIGA